MRVMNAHLPFLPQLGHNQCCIVENEIAACITQNMHRHDLSVT